MPGNSIPITGEVGGISETDAARLSVVAVVGNTVLATAQLRPDGGYRLNVPAEAARAESAFALQIVVLPTTAAAPDRVADAPRVTISPADLAGHDAIAAPGLALARALIDGWQIFWREWCVSGTVVGPDGCPAPGAEVTAYTVSWSTGGYTEVARATATTGPDGTFALCFPWWELLLPCWPCEPFWWRCWPWWWEFDILHVIEALETRATSGPQSVALFQPEGSALIRGQGFPAAASAGVIIPDPARTALIARKFRDAALRELFPWRWWCCDQPNVVFGVTQGGTTILAPDPATETRWCMESGQTVTLTGNKATLTSCPGGPYPTSGYVWTAVGNILTSSIDTRGLAQDSGDNTDVAFQGSLSLYASFAPDAFAYYQVNGSVWNAPAFRGGAQPPAAVAPAESPIYAPLYLPAWVWDPATEVLTYHYVKMGPFTANGYSGLYAAPNARATQPAIPGLPAFTVPAGNSVFWGDEGLVLSAQDTTLLGGIPFGAVDLTLLGFDQNFDPVTFTPDAALTLAIDSTPITVQQVGTITAWQAPGVPAPQTGFGDCPAYDVGPSGYIEVPVTIQDANGFLCEYELEAQFGNGNSPVVNPPGLRGYKIVVPPPAFPPDIAAASWTGGTETMTFPGQTVAGAPVDCCYEFRLYYAKRVTNGGDWPTSNLAEGDFQTISLKFSS